MKKYITAAVLVAFAFTVLFSIGCERLKIKGEIIKFDEEYWEIAEELEKKQSVFFNKLNEIGETSEINEINKITDLIKDHIDDYNIYKLIMLSSILKNMEEFKSSFISSDNQDLKMMILR